VIDPPISRDPAPRLYDAHHRLPAQMGVDMLHGDRLSALAAVAVEGFEERRIGAGKLIRLGEVLAPALEELLINHAIAALWTAMSLRQYLQFVLRTDAGQCRESGADLLLLRLVSTVWWQEYCSSHSEREPPIFLNVRF
jgi:hypothetical protein